MHAVTTERLIAIIGLALAVAFFATWEPVFGILSFVLLVGIAPWLDLGSPD